MQILFKILQLHKLDVLQGFYFFHDGMCHLHLTLKMHEESQLCLFGFITTWLGIITTSDLFAHSNYMFMFYIHVQKWSFDSSWCPFDFATSLWTLQSRFLHHLFIDSYFKNDFLSTIVSLSNFQMMLLVISY